MARTGRFGRQPRSAPSLTNTLVAIAREWQQQRAENIMSAWQKGGLFEGEKATDEKVLAFWKDRAANVSKDDPLYDLYSNSVVQLEYTIAESKMTADYAQGKKNDSQMVSFYMNWSKKVPRNSEFYRVLMRDAGQYMRQSRANGEAAARRAAEERYQRQQAGTRQKMEAAGEYAIDTLRRLAQSGNASRAIGGLIAAPGSGSDLTDFDPSDPGVMMRLIGLITPREYRPGGTPFGAPSGAGTAEVLYHDDDGKPVTGADIIAQFQKLDPTFRPGVPFDVQYVTGLLDRQMQGINERIKRANDTGHMQDVTSLAKSKEYVAMLSRQVEAYPVQKAYQEARADYEAVVADKTSSPAAILNAWRQYSSTLTSLANDPRIETNDAMRSQLAAEAAGEAGTPTLNETFTGLAGGDFTGRATDIAENIANIENLQAQVEAVTAGSAVWTYGNLDSNGVFVPQAGGRMIGAATPDAVEAGGQNAQVVVVPDPRGGAPLRMAVTALPVFATARDPRTGEPLDATDSQPIAWVYDIPNGGSTKTTYGFQTKDGFVFSTNPPWKDGLSMKGTSKDGQKQLEVDFTPLVEQQLLGGRDQFTNEFKSTLDQSKDADLGHGFYIRGAKAAGSRGAEARPGQLIFDPQELAWGSDDRATLGSTDPMTDFHSLTLATLMQDQEGQNILTNLDKNPAFKAQMDADTYMYAGYEKDFKTGQWLPGAAADQSKLDRAMSQQGIASASKSFGEFIGKAAALFTRDATGSAYTRGGPQASVRPEDAFTTVTKLATDLVKGTPFEPLGAAFQPGTNKVNTVKVNEATGFAITPVKTIKAPSILPQDMPKPTTVATTTYDVPKAPTQTGSTAPGGRPSSSGGGAYSPPTKHL